MKNKLMELVDEFGSLKFDIGVAGTAEEWADQKRKEAGNIKSKIQKIADSLPRLPVGQRVLVDGESTGRIVEYCYVIEYEDEPSNFSTLTEDDGVEPIKEDK